MLGLYYLSQMRLIIEFIKTSLSLLGQRRGTAAQPPEGPPPTRCAADNAIAAYDCAADTVLKPPLHLAEDSVHLWLLNLDADADDSFCWPCLSGEELRTARDFAAPALSCRYTRAHGLLRHILGRYLRTAPERLSISTTPQGKPFLRNRELHFNLSHSEGTAVIAICRKREIGVDIEMVRPVPESSEIARRWFSTSENKWIQASPEPALAFLRCWVCREALLKASGSGLAAAPDSVRLRVEGDTLHHYGPYLLSELHLLPRFAVAVACSAVDSGNTRCA